MDTGIIAAAYEAYSADPRLLVVMPGGQARPDDLGAFTEAAEEALDGVLPSGSLRPFVVRAYRHYRNEAERAKKPEAEAFASGFALAWVERAGGLNV